MASDEQIRDKRLQYVINKAAGRIFALSSDNINEYEYLAGEILLSQQHRIIEQAKPTNSLLDKSL